MSLTNPPARSALRSVIFAVVILAMIAFVYIFTDRVHSEEGLRESLRYAFLIILVGTLGYITETGIRSVKAKGFFGEIDLGADAPQAAQAVADSAQETADEVKGASQ